MKKKKEALKHRAKKVSKHSKGHKKHPWHQMIAHYTAL